MPIQSLDKKMRQVMMLDFYLIQSFLFIIILNIYLI